MRPYTTGNQWDQIIRALVESGRKADLALAQRLARDLDEWDVEHGNTPHTVQLVEFYVAKRGAR
jgi:hypothetical protein